MLVVALGAVDWTTSGDATGTALLNSRGVGVGIRGVEEIIGIASCAKLSSPK